MRPVIPGSALIASVGIVCAAAMLAGCQRKESAPLYEQVAVERRTIVVSAAAAGAIEPVRTVDVKSKASGEIIRMDVETGDDVGAGALLAVVDPRQPRNALAQAEADLEVAKARLANASAELARADTLFHGQAITETEYEQKRLDYVNANAEVVRAQTNRETARDQMTDTEVRAPVAGTIIAKSVELGTVISSPTRDVGGGTVLLKMANLDTVQVRTLVDETDIGKVQAGLAASIVVDAYANRSFEGKVLKIEPMATVQQNVTMFPVLVRIANPGHLLKPGMNTEVEVHVGRGDSVLAIPYAALRTRRDVASAAMVLGLDPAEIEKTLADAREKPGSPGAASAPGTASTPGMGGPGTAQAATPGETAAPGATLTLADGRTVTLPKGMSETDVKKVMEKRRSGAELSDSEQAMLRQVFAQFGGSRGGSGRSQRGGDGPAGSGAGGGEGAGGGGAGRYIVFVLRNGEPTPVEVTTGLTDLDYIEVVSGLTEQDTVLVLPSASLVNSQREMQERMQRMTGGGGIPGMQQQTPGQGQRPTTR